jgi:hypothetical protein
MATLLKFPSRPFPKGSEITGHLNGFAIRSRGVALAVFPTFNAAADAFRAGRQMEA